MSGVIDALRFTKRLAKAALGRDLLLRQTTRQPTEFHGTKYGGWSILRDSLTPASVVYSFGIGEDASFDVSLISRYGCRVHAFDPTPKSVAWVEANIHDERFVLSTVGGRGERWHVPVIPAKAIGFCFSVNDAGHAHVH